MRTPWGGGAGLELLLAGAIAGGAATALLVLPTPARAQGPSGPCDLYFENTPTTRSTFSKLPSGKYNSYIGGGVIAHCTNQPGVTLKSDSAEHYGEQDMMYLIGHVHYTDPRATLDAHHATYFVADGRLLADTDVVAVMSSGTTMHGPHADYLRALPGRPRQHLTAVGRPHMHLVQRDSASGVPDTAGVDADRVFMDGDSLVFASRKVVIVRTDLTATSDSAAMDQGRQFARLVGSPVIVGHDKQHPFTLKGDMIDLFAVEHQLTRVVSMLHATAVSRDMHLTADTIDLRFADKVLSRAYAWGPSRAHAITPERDILADSIDVIMPEEVAHQVRAVRKAYATSIPDSTHFKSTERDWMKGDTIVAYFDTTAIPARRDTSQRGPDQGGAAPSPGGGSDGAMAVRSVGAPRGPTAAPKDTQPEVRTIVATGNARALYQLAPRERTETRPAINYVRGRVITIQLRARQVQTVSVVDSAAGLYLEPAIDSVKLDSAKKAKARADTLPAYLRKKARKRAAGQTPPTATPAATPATTPATMPAARDSQPAASLSPATPADTSGVTPADTGAGSPRATSPATPPGSPPATPRARSRAMATARVSAVVSQWRAVVAPSPDDARRLT